MEIALDCIDKWFDYQVIKELGVVAMLSTKPVVPGRSSVNFSYELLLFSGKDCIDSLYDYQAKAELGTMPCEPTPSYVWDQDLDPLSQNGINGFFGIAPKEGKKAQVTSPIDMWCCRESR